jgi:hypothetical protein
VYFTKKYYPSIDKVDRWNGWESVIVIVSEKLLKEYKQTLFATVDYLSSEICFKSNKILFWKVVY